MTGPLITHLLQLLQCRRAQALAFGRYQCFPLNKLKSGSKHRLGGILSKILVNLVSPIQDLLQMLML